MRALNVHGVIAEVSGWRTSDIQILQRKLQRMLRKPRGAAHRVHGLLPSTRRAAKVAGERMYFTGKPCPKGHIAPRLVDNCSCRECVTMVWAAKRQKAYASLRALRELGVKI